MVPLVTGIEYHGRLARRDGRPANPGRYDLRFALHSDDRIKRCCWSEDHNAVTVAPGGFFTVVLGLETPIKAEYFSSGPRWTSVRIVRSGNLEEETGPRVPVLGGVVCLENHARRTLGRLLKLEDLASEAAQAPQPEELKTSIESLGARLIELEDGRMEAVEIMVQELSRRVKALDGDGRRLELLEERVDELDGPDGDFVEITERLDAMEGGAPKELESRLYRLEQTVAELASRMEGLLALLETESMADATWEIPSASATDLDVTAT